MELFHKMISGFLGIPERQISSTLHLLGEGATIPFISRYRKEATGGLDEVQIEQIKEQHDKLCDIAKRKETILGTITEQGKLTAELEKRINDTWNQTDFVKVSKFDGYWQPGLPKLDSITWRPVVDNNTRAAMLQTGEAQFAFPIPYEQAPLLAKNSKLELVASPSIMQRYISMNVTQKPFDNPKVREAINYAINRQALVKVAFAGYATPATGVVPPSIAYAQTYTAWPYDPAKARQLLKEAGYPNGFSTTLWSSHNHSTAQKVLQFTQQQLAQVGIKAQVTAMDAGQRAAEVEGKGQKESGVRMFYTGWSASTGEADWALSPLFASQNWPPTLFNTAFYSNPQVDNALSEALKTTDPQQKTKLYKEAQDIIWKESPWVPLVVEKLVSAHSKNLTGFYIQPDTGFSFEQADLTP